MPRESLRTVANTLSGGGLETDLREWRGQNLSFREIARKILDKYEVDVTSETVRKWCAHLDIPTQRVPVAERPAS